MNEFHERLILFVEEKFDGNMSNFAKKVGISPAQINSYRISGRILPHKYRKAFAEVGLNWDWYETGVGEMLLNSNTGDVHENFKIVIKNIDKLSMAEIKEFIQAARNMSEEMVS